MALKRLAAPLLIAGSLTFAVGVLPSASSQDKRDHPGADAQQVATQCKPVLVKKAKLKPKTIHVGKGAKSTGHTPIIAFQITSAGEVLNAKVKRSSGIRDMDDSALSSIHYRKYNNRPGCPVIDSEADVLIHLM